MQHRFSSVIAILTLAFPFAALADLTGNVTLAPGDRFSLETGVTTSSNVATGDLRFNASSLTPQASVGIFNYKTSGAAGTTLYNGLTEQILAALPAASYSESAVNNAALVV